MKKSFLSLIMIIGLFVTSKAQETVKFAPIDSSPVDLVYYPLNATKVKESAPLIKVTYSRPHKKGRIIFGGLEQFGKIWRLGANENTEIKFFKNVKIGNKKIKKGSYGLFAIPEKNEWTIIISKQNDMWGAFSYDPSFDIARLTVPVENLNNAIEDLSITFYGSGQKTNLIIAWDNSQVKVPIQIL